MEKVRFVIFLTGFSLLMGYIGFSATTWYKGRTYAMLSFDKTKYDMDTVYSQSDAEVHFVFKNTGNNDLKIHKIETSCGCTIPSWNTGLLPPTSVDSFRVSYNIENKGYFIKEIMVYSNSRSSPDHLVIEGYVPFNETK
ncbi:DUF1573 domain-containing protein [Lunatimonas lonarensis]|uniref:DUF1573 domain-containing protein n=1 Tax=Lunatimonas lonarensis TaxID=1232681 RepID=UPI0005630D9C|nr:DUF1573 domain-containing protein [Lunatimonas lonarensis]